MIDKSKIFGYDFEVLSSVPGGGWFCVTFINYENRNEKYYEILWKSKGIE